MNGGSIVAVLAIIACLRASAEAPRENRWTDLSRLLGETESGAAFRELVGAGEPPQRIDRGTDEHLLVFEGRGYSIVVRGGRVATVFLQLLNGKKIRDVAYRGTMPLGLQTIWLTPDEAREMCAAGVSLAEPDQFAWLPIHRAAANDRDDVIRLLVEWGSPVGPAGTERWTPLHLASVSRSPRAVRALLEAGADVHARSEFGQTPLHLAVGTTVTEPLLETVRALVSAGADRNAADEDGTTPLDKAREIPHPELRRILRDDAA